MFNIKLKDLPWDKIYWLVLFVVLLVVSLPTFSYPPLSDDWHLFYSFHDMHNLPGTIKWLHVLNYDPCEQMRFQPVSRLFYYGFYLLFGANFVPFKIFNFLFYFLHLIILYKFAKYFLNNRKVLLAFIWVYAFLFTHFDIAIWSHHVYLIAGFTSLLFGFIQYMEFLKNPKKIKILWIVLLFLLGMLCYESFFFWPFALLLLNRIKKVRIYDFKKYFSFKVNTIIFSSIYAVYFLLYWFTRTLGTHSAPAHSIKTFLKINNFFLTGLLVLFNGFYNNIFVNLWPFSSMPFKITENIYMWGNIIDYIDHEREWIMFLGGGMVSIFLLIFVGYLVRNKKIEQLKILSLFFILLFTQSYIVFFGRLATNAGVYCLTEFRYQYINNAFMMLIIAFIVDNWLLSKRKTKIIYSFLIIIFIFNIIGVNKIISIYGVHLKDLKNMCLSIREKIRAKEINDNKKIYLSYNIPDYLPHLCWNIELGEYYMEKTYRWMFPRKEVSYFTDRKDQAYWTVDKENFNVVRNNQGNQEGKAKVIDEMIAEDYFALSKAQKYYELANDSTKKDEYKRAEKMFKRSLEINPSAHDVYLAFGRWYKIRGNYIEAEKMLKKAFEVNPDADTAYMTLYELASLYCQRKNYGSAIKILEKAINKDPYASEAYLLLGDVYSINKEYSSLEKTYKKAIKNVSHQFYFYLMLANLYNDTQRYQEAEQVLLNALEMGAKYYDNCDLFYDALERSYRNQDKE